MAKHLHAPELTDEVIEAAFCGTNFGRTDYRDFLAHSVLKKACDWHCGYTITCIMVNLKLITPKTHKVTKLGKLFLTDSYPDPLRESRDAPPSPVKLPEWTDQQCLEFISIAFRHAEISGDIQMDDIRVGIKMVNAGGEIAE